MTTRRLASAVLLTALLMGLAAPAAASKAFCISIWIPGVGWVIHCKTFPYIPAIEPCPLEPIDEQDVILCPPGSIGSGPYNVQVGNDGSHGGASIFGVGLGIVHPDPSTPDAVFLIPGPADEWATAILPAAAWDAGEFDFANDGSWSPPAAGSFADTFGPDATHAIVHWVESSASSPVAPGEQQVLTLYGMVDGDVSYALFGDGSVLAAGDAQPFQNPVSAEQASWSELKVRYR